MPLRRPSLPHGPWPALCVLASLVVAVPVGTVLLAAAGDAGEDWRHLVDTRLGLYATNTLLLAAGVSLIALVAGVGTAWLVTACDFPGRRTFRWALLLPLAVPAYLSAYAYTDLLQFSGPVQSWLRANVGDGRWLPPVRSLGGAAVVLGFALYPYVYLAARAAFAEGAGSALEVGRSLGRGPLRCFFTVALPLARPAIAAGLALVLMETLADFGAAEYCAVDTFATGVYRAWHGLESPAATARLSGVLLGGVAALVLVELLARRGARFHAVTTRQVLRPARLGPIAATLAFLACLAPVAVGFAGPALIFTHMAATVGDARAAEVVVDFGPNTLKVALIGSALAVALALIVAYGRRLGGPIARAAGRFAASGYAMPGTVVAVGLLAPLGWLDHRINDLTRSLFDWTPGLVLTGSVFAVVLGYQTRFLAVALAMVESGLTRVRRSVDDAARSLGATGAGLLFRVHLPLLRGSLLAAGLLVFVDVAKELPVTLMLRPFNFETLAVRVYQLAGDERLEEAAFGALAIIAVGLVPTIVLSNLLDRPRGPNAAKAAFQ